MNVTTTIKLSTDDIKKIVLEHIKREQNIEGDLVFHVNGKLSGGGDVFYTRHVFDGATFTNTKE